MTHDVELYPSAKRCMQPCMLQACDPLSDVIQIQVHSLCARQSLLRLAQVQDQLSALARGTCLHSTGGQTVVRGGRSYTGVARALPMQRRLCLSCATSEMNFSSVVPISIP